MKSRILIAAGALVALLASCASTELAYHDFADEPLQLVVFVAPGAEIEADYFVSFDPDDPVGTIISIGSSVAKAGQVEAVRDKMDVAMRDLDVGLILEEEVGSYFERIMEMRLTDSRSRASYVLNVEVEHYGIEASGPGSGVEFMLDGRAELFDHPSGDGIWRDRFRMSEPFSPVVFGLPGSAGNVLSAAMLSELTEEQIAAGIEKVTRDAAWEIAREFEDDLYRARRRG